DLHGADRAAAVVRDTEIPARHRLNGYPAQRRVRRNWIDRSYDDRLHLQARIKVKDCRVSRVGSDLEQLATRVREFLPLVIDRVTPILVNRGSAGSRLLLSIDKLVRSTIAKNLWRKPVSTSAPSFTGSTESSRTSKKPVVMYTANTLLRVVKLLNNFFNSSS